MRQPGWPTCSETSQHPRTVVDYLLKELGLRLDDGEGSGSFDLVLRSVSDRLETQEVRQTREQEKSVGN